MKFDMEVGGVFLTFECVCVIILVNVPEQITYMLKPIGRDHAKFDINPETGVITTRETFDREEKDEYYITVVAQDGARSDRPNHYPPGTPNQGIHFVECLNVSN